MIVTPPKDFQIIGGEVAIRWADGVEDFLPGALLRERSPSAENTGERDIFGKKYGGNGPREFSGVVVVGWKAIGNYAATLEFSDGHNTGIFSWKYLRALGDELRSTQGQ